MTITNERDVKHLESRKQKRKAVYISLLTLNEHSRSIRSVETQLT